MKSRCHKHSLADGAACGVACRVDQCTCGHVHLTIGALTLRLDPAAFHDVGVVIEQALRELDSRSGRAGLHPGDRGALN